MLWRGVPTACHVYRVIVAATCQTFGGGQYTPPYHVVATRGCLNGISYAFSTLTRRDSVRNVQSVYSNYIQSRERSKKRRRPPKRLTISKRGRRTKNQSKQNHSTKASIHIKTRKKNKKQSKQSHSTKASNFIKTRKKNKKPIKKSQAH